MDQNNQERRRSPRAVFPCILKIVSSGKEIKSHTENISRGGIKVFLEEEIEHGSLVGLEIMVNRATPIKCEGKVMWTRKVTDPIGEEVTMYSVGIMFQSLSDPDREYIKKLVERLIEGRKTFDDRHES